MEDGQVEATQLTYGALVDEMPTAKADPRMEYVRVEVSVAGGTARLAVVVALGLVALGVTALGGFLLEAPAGWDLACSVLTFTLVLAGGLAVVGRSRSRR
ncbi:hypothetical protein J4573_48020 [Actinomadura barringtoniae]|uniref:Uncharacterized protein n=1 Tax=Actinomadura barringtoniae TaxID=1427535 RepID=A0A939PRH4_9ACTN|nr:hypothetical protein [Actinomadura barringtoniae]MBO2454908.1 hypothetical protein [Actinomadura barringtoniae]